MTKNNDGVIFLDVDGVLVPWDRFDPSCMQNLVCIQKCTGAAIVITSTWRLYPHQKTLLEAAMTEYGLEPAGYTPNLRDSGMSRAEEILDWLDRHPQTSRKVILDDDNLGRGGSVLADCHLRTDRLRGLTGEVVERAIAILTCDQTGTAK